MEGLEHVVDVIAVVVEQFLDLFAIAVVAIGACEAVVGMLRLRRTRDVWLRFAHWLVAALTFELAADVVSTTVAPTWPDLGKLAAIAGIRTFLTYFLDRDVERAGTELAA
jgi:uncharacterized membrane protein